MSTAPTPELIERAFIDLLDPSSRVVQFTGAHDPLWSGVMVLAPGESVPLATGARHDLLILAGTVETGDGRALDAGDFTVRGGNAGLRAGATGAQVFAFRDTASAAFDEIVVPRDERPWREGRTPGMLVAMLPSAGHALSLVMWQPGARARHHAHPRGEDIFVVRGELCENDRHPAGSWMRLHPGAWHSPHVETPTLILVRSGHLKRHPKKR
jgi:quercetin dioxygenase-like cupin family protein